MRLFSCPHCGGLVYFENNACSNCGSDLAYDPSQTAMLAGKREGLVFRCISSDQARTLCANAEDFVCNWVLPSDTTERFCTACRHNGIIPNLAVAGNLAKWRTLEEAKHRLVYSLLRWNLPLKTRQEDPVHGLIFDFPDDQPAEKVMTGHDNGVITIALQEADDIERERRRHQFAEPYRTPLGHFRHEIGHHYWDLLVRDGGKLEQFRDRFGDEAQDYGAALQKHYDEGAPPDWQQHHVSAYATTHPWEDFAETWAHYFHIVDTLEMAANFGIQVSPSIDKIGGLSAVIDFDPYVEKDFTRISKSWMPFVFAMNSVNRAIGLQDMYPFMLTPEVLGKLGFVHAIVRGEG